MAMARSSSNLRRVGLVGGAAGGVLVLTTAVGLLTVQGSPRANLTTHPMTVRTTAASPGLPWQTTRTPPATPRHVVSPQPTRRLPGPAANPTTAAHIKATTDAHGDAHREPALLWPFTTEAAVFGWEASYRSGGHQPWHASPCDTAALFARSVLGLTNPTLDQCVVHGDQARVQVRPSGEKTTTGAVTTISELRIGDDPGGWVVVDASAPR